MSDIHQLLQIPNQKFYPISLDINRVTNIVVDTLHITRKQPVRDPPQHFYQFFDI